MMGHFRNKTRSWRQESSLVFFLTLEPWFSILTTFQTQKKIILFIYFWLCWIFVAVWAFFSLWSVGATLQCGLLIVVASLVAQHGLQGKQTSVIVARGLSSGGSWALEHRLSSCGTQAQLFHSMWGLPGSGIKPMSPELTGGFFTTEPRGKPQIQIEISESLATVDTAMEKSKTLLHTRHR